MKIRESALWKSLRKHLPPDAMAERIENSVGSNMPDVLIVRAGRTFLVELKADLDGISKGQADWARRWSAAGGWSWFLIAVGHVHYLVPGSAGVRVVRNPNIILTYRVDSIQDAIWKMLN